jgi:hypothetical protein
VLGFTQAEFTEAYENNRSELRHVAIEGSVTAVEVIEWFNRVNVMNGTMKREWQGTHKELLGELGRREGLPRTARGLQAELARVEPNLIAAGVVLTRLSRESGTGRRPIRLTRTVEHQSVVDATAAQAREKHEAKEKARIAAIQRQGGTPMPPDDEVKANREDFIASQAAIQAANATREAHRDEIVTACKKWLAGFLIEPMRKKRVEHAGTAQSVTIEGIGIFTFTRKDVNDARAVLGIQEEMRQENDKFLKYWLPIESVPKSAAHFFTRTSAIQ